MASRGTHVAWSEKGAPWSGSCRAQTGKWSALLSGAETCQDKSSWKAVICWIGRTENKFIWCILLTKVLTQHWISVRGIWLTLIHLLHQQSLMLEADRYIPEKIWDQAIAEGCVSPLQLRQTFRSLGLRLQRLLSLVLVTVWPRLANHRRKSL